MDQTFRVLKRYVPVVSDIIWSNKVFTYSNHWIPSWHKMHPSAQELV